MKRISISLISLCVLVSPVISAESWKELREKAVQQMDAGANTEAESGLLAAWKLVSPDAGDPQGRVVVAEDLAYFYLEQGKAEQSLTFCHKAIDASRRANGDMSPRNADLMNSTAVVLRGMGKLNEAEQMHLAALKLLADGGNQNHFSAAQIYYALGILYAYTGRFSDSETSLMKAIRIATPAAKKYPEQTARMMDGLARLYTNWDRLNEAGQYMRSATRIVNRMTDPDPKLRIDLLDSQGALLFQQQKFNDAEKAWLQAREVMSTCPACESHGYAVLSHLGELYIRLEQYDKAESMMRETIAVADRVPAISSVDRVILRGELGLVLTRKKQYDKGAPMLAEAVAQLEKAGRPVELALLAGYYGDCFADQGYWSQAAEQYERSMQLREKVLGNHPLTVTAMMSCATAYKKLHRKSEAKKLMARAENMSHQCSSCSTMAQTVDVRAFH